METHPAGQVFDFLGWNWDGLFQLSPLGLTLNIVVRNSLGYATSSTVRAKEKVGLLVFLLELHSHLQIHRHILLISSPTCEGIPGRLLVDQFDIKAAKQLHYIQVDLNQSNVLANA
jgi:hypothetical protein